MNLRTQLAQAEERIIRDALETCGTIHIASDHLGIHRNTLSRKLVKFGITDAELSQYRQKHEVWTQMERGYGRTNKLPSV
jgi:DNA-binding NtrC family response regulator